MVNRNSRARGAGRFRCVLAFAAAVVGMGLLIAPVPGAAAPLAASATAAGPAKVVDGLDVALLKTMKAGKKAGIAGRIKIMAPAVRSSFDVPRISRMVLGQYWKALSRKHRDTFVDLLTHLIVVSYASNFDAYSQQQFKITGVRHKGKTAFVSTEFSDPGSGESHSFDYVVHAVQPGEWKIVNVIADGVSDVAVKRAEYTGILGKGSFQDLIDALRKQIKHAEISG